MLSALIFTFAALWIINLFTGIFDAPAPIFGEKPVALEPREEREPMSDEEAAAYCDKVEADLKAEIARLTKRA